MNATLARVDGGTGDWATERLARADFDMYLAGARRGLEELAQAATALEQTLPERVGQAVREGVRAEAVPVARQVAELRGLMNAVLRRLERVEDVVHAEREARVDDLALLVDLVSSGWAGVDRRLARLERALENGSGAVVYQIDERRSSAEAG